MRSRLPALLLAILSTCALWAQVGDEKRILLPAGAGHKPFDVTKHGVPLEEIISPGPPKDGIPSIDEPKFVNAREANRFLRPESKVLAIAHGREAKAYPINILNWHEIVNDFVGGRAIKVTW